MRLKIRDAAEIDEQPVEVYLEQEDDSVVLCVADTEGLEWAILRVKPDGTLELCSCMDSDDFCSTDGYVMVEKE
jgi:hypothetical protein